jgi:hypothetical protein
MCLRDQLAQVQAQTHTAAVAGAGGVGSVKGLC